MASPRINVRLDQRDYDALVRLAAERSQTISQAVQEAVRQHVARVDRRQAERRRRKGKR